MDLLVGALVPGGVSPGYSGPCTKLAGVGVPGRVLLPLACKDGCPLCLLGSRDTCGVGGRLWLSPEASRSPWLVGEPQHSAAWLCSWLTTS